MIRFHVASALVLVTLCSSATAPVAATPTETMTPHEAADPTAPAVTEANLIDSEAFWPFHVDLVEEWQAGASGPVLRPGLPSMLLRVEADGMLRISYRGDAIVDVPIGKTDVVERANRIRLGKLAKQAPNLTLAIGQSLVGVDDDFKAVGIPGVIERPGFLLLFADPESEGLPSWASTLAPIHDRAGVASVFVPTGDTTTDRRIFDQLTEAGWKGLFAYQRMAPSILGGFLPRGARTPSVALFSAEGRLLFESAWKEGLGAEVEAALAAHFPASSADANGPRVASGRP